MGRVFAVALAKADGWGGRATRAKLAEAGARHPLSHAARNSSPIEGEQERPRLESANAPSNPTRATDSAETRHGQRPTTQNQRSPEAEKGKAEAGGGWGEEVVARVQHPHGYVGRGC